MLNLLTPRKQLGGEESEVRKGALDIFEVGALALDVELGGLDLLVGFMDVDLALVGGFLFSVNH